MERQVVQVSRERKLVELALSTIRVLHTCLGSAIQYILCIMYHCKNMAQCDTESRYPQ